MFGCSGFLPTTFSNKFLNLYRNMYIPPYYFIIYIGRNEKGETDGAKPSFSVSQIELTDVKYLFPKFNDSIQLSMGSRTYSDRTEQAILADRQVVSPSILQA
jgi:hypothetical protein